MTSKEIRDAITLAVMAFVVLPLMPDRALGPYGALNPHRIWLAAVAFAAISWFGYIAVHAVGPRRGSAVAGFAGGFVSATATTATMARRCRDGEQLSVMVSAALLASVATFLQLFGVLAVVDGALAWQLLPACILGVLVLVGLGLFGLRSHRGRESRRELVAPAPAPTNAADGSVVLVAGLTGLADAHAGALAAASMSVAGDLPASTTALAIGAAVFGNMVVKVVVSFVVGGRGFGARFAAAVVPATAAFVLFAALSG